MQRNYGYSVYQECYELFVKNSPQPISFAGYSDASLGFSGGVMPHVTLWDYILQCSFFKSQDTLVEVRLFFYECSICVYGYNKIIGNIMICLT